MSYCLSFFSLFFCSGREIILRSEYGVGFLGVDRAYDVGGCGVRWRFETKE